MRGRDFFSYVLFLLLGCFFVSGTAQGNVESILCRLAERSRESHSDSVLIMHNDRPIFQYHSGFSWQQLDARAMTTSIASLAIGLMIEEGILDSVDVPVYQFYPELDQGNKRLITIRHLLSHTSGLQVDACLDEIYRADDIIQLALCAELTTQPGTCYSCNDKAINLISGIVKKATGCSIHDYLNSRLFAPLGIKNVSWLADKSGNEYAMSHMLITAPDLAKIGSLINSKGMWRGNRILRPEWFNIISQPSQSLNPFYGLSWWMEYYSIQCYWDDGLLQQYLNAGVNPDFVSRLRSLQGRIVYIDGRTTTPTGHNIFSQEVISLLGGPECANCFYQQTATLQLPIARWKVASFKSLAARQSHGQQLIIFPNYNLVAVRQSTCAGEGGDPFNDFGALVEELAYRMMEPNI